MAFLLLLVPSLHLSCYGVQAGFAGIGDISRTQFWQLVQETGSSGYVALKALALQAPRDRFEVRDMFLGFVSLLRSEGAINAGVDEEISDAALVSHERSERSPGALNLRDSDEHAKLLGLREALTVTELKSAYYQQVALWHPDKLDGMAPELKVLATERLARINKAYATLCEDQHSSAVIGQKS